MVQLVPTFRSSCSVAARTFTNFGKSWLLTNLLILVPLYRSEVPDRTRRLWCRGFRSAVLVSCSRAAAIHLVGALALFAFSSRCLAADPVIAETKQTTDNNKTQHDDKNTEDDGSEVV